MSVLNVQIATYQKGPAQLFVKNAIAKNVIEGK